MAAPKLAMAAVQKAVKSKLGSSVTIDSVAVPVIGNPKPGQTKPYISIMACEEEPYNTLGSYGSVVYQHVDIFAKETEAWPVLDIKGALSLIRQALDGQTLTLEAGEGTFMGCHWVDRAATVDYLEDGETAHGRITFRVIVDDLDTV